MIASILTRKMTEVEIQDYQATLQARLRCKDISTADYLRQINNRFCWQCLKCHHWIPTNNSSVIGIIICSNCGTTYEDGFLYPKEMNFFALDEGEIPLPTLKTPYDYYKDIKLGELCPYCRQATVEKGYSAGKKCPNNKCDFWKYHQTDFEHNERKKPHNYKNIKIDEICPYCKREIVGLGAWGGKMCPDKACRFWHYHKDDFEHSEGENAWGVIMDWLDD